MAMRKKKEEDSVVFLGTYTDVKSKPHNHDSLLKFNRAGVMVKCIQGEKVWYLFSLQLGSITHEYFLRDFGGHIEKEEGEHPLDAAVREFHEESLGAFTEYINPQRLESSHVLGVNDSLYILLQLYVHPRLIQEKFRMNRKNLPNIYGKNIPEFLLETDDILEITRPELHALKKYRHHVPYRDTGFSWGPNLWKNLQLMWGRFVGDDGSRNTQSNWRDRDRNRPRERNWREPRARSR